MKYWVMKSEPSVFSFDDLMSSNGRTEMWDGVRNYQARNFMRDEMHTGDPVLFYHSNTKRPGVVGVARVASSAYPDPTQFDPESTYFDSKSTRAKPRWFLVDIQGEYHLPRIATLEQLKSEQRLAGLPLVKKGNRLSVIPIAEEHYRTIVEIASQTGPPSVHPGI